MTQISLISVSCIEGHKGGSRQWTNIAEVIPEKHSMTNHTAVISKLDPKIKYVSRLLAYNKVGSKYFFTEEKEAGILKVEHF